MICDRRFHLDQPRMSENHGTWIEMPQLLNSFKSIIPDAYVDNLLLVACRGITLSTGCRRHIYIYENSIVENSQSDPTARPLPSNPGMIKVQDVCKRVSKESTIYPVRSERNRKRLN